MKRYVTSKSSIFDMNHFYIKFIQVPIIFYILLFITPNLLIKVESRDQILVEKDGNRQERECCHTNPPSFEIKAILMPCAVNYCPCSIPGQALTQKQADIECDAENSNGRLSNCTKKLIITIRMSNVGKTHCKNQYVVVDHVYDPSSEHKQRILYPYVLKISQKPIMQTYSLEKESSVNEKSTELVINKNNKGYKGCKTTGEDTTCRRVLYNEKPVPYSTGFCCSCDDTELQRELSKFEAEEKLLEKTYKRDNNGEDITNDKENKPTKRQVRQLKEDKTSSTTESLHSSIHSNLFKRKQMLDLQETLNSFDVNDFGVSAEDSPVHIRRKFNVN